MIWGRWKDYIANGNGGNIELKSLDFEYIQKNFRYSILEIYKSTTDDDAMPLNWGTSTVMHYLN